MKLNNTEKHPELFIALETQEIDQQILQSLTTELMQWEEGIWIMDLSLYYSYWARKSGETGYHPLSLWRKVFNHLLGEEPHQNQSNVIKFAPSYRASCARNPWSAVLLLRVMREKSVKGLISLNSSTGQSLLTELSWQSWWKEIDILEAQMLAAKIRGFKQAGLRQQCKRLQLAIPRLGFKRPRDMEILNKDGIRRRFGKILADVWQWTYDKIQTKAATIRQTGFPWQSWRFQNPPVIKRILDYPLLVWDQFVPLLVEDFDKLCQTIKNTGERITRIEWSLTLENMNRLQVPILFRNPHNLWEEKEKHITSLLQANYGFTDTLNKTFPPDPETGNTDAMPFVLAWELEITASLKLPDIVLDIFGQAQERSYDIETLLRLENELPVDLSRFAPQDDWFPEDSFSPEHFEAEEVSTENSEINRSLMAIAENRPLYIRRNPRPIGRRNAHPQKTFLESTMTKWWKEEQSNGRERHYYKQIDPEGNSLWIFQDTEGAWYQHGIFG